jgi:hypothetical protein
MLISAEAVYPESVIEVKEKIKSRYDLQKGTMKLSKHYILSLFGPKHAHRRAFHKIFQAPFNKDMSLEVWLKNVRESGSKSGNYASVPIEYLTAPDSKAPLMGYDPQAMPGGPNGISTLYSKKNNSDPAPRYGITERICLGQTVSVQPAPFPEPHEIDSPHLSDQAKLHMLRKMSYTTPKEEMEFYSYELLHALKSPDTSKIDPEVEV